MKKARIEIEDHEDYGEDDHWGKHARSESSQQRQQSPIEESKFVQFQEKRPNLVEEIEVLDKQRQMLDEAKEKEVHKARLKRKDFTSFTQEDDQVPQIDNQKQQNARSVQFPVVSKQVTNPTTRPGMQQQQAYVPHLYKAPKPYTPPVQPSPADSAFAHFLANQDKLFDKIPYPRAHPGTLAYFENGFSLIDQNPLVHIMHFKRLVPADMYGRMENYYYTKNPPKDY